MACEKCKDISESFPANPFRLQGRPCSAKLHACECGTKWWQFNTVYHLWREIPEETFSIMQNDPHVVVNVNTGEIIGRDHDFF